MAGATMLVATSQHQNIKLVAIVTAFARAASVASKHQAMYAHDAVSVCGRPETPFRMRPAAQGGPNERIASLGGS